MQMPIYSFTQERLDKLKKQIEDKKAEHDELEAKSEKDLWCKDLDDFVDEWENQLRLDAETQTTIRRMNRRVSRKIGAGKGRRNKDDDDYMEKKPARAPKEKKIETKTVDRFQKMMSGTQASQKPKLLKSSQVDGPADEVSDDDDYFAALMKPKVKKEVAVEADPDPVEEVAPPANIARSKRAAAAKPKSWAIDLDTETEDDSKFLDIGDVGAMVKGIGATSTAEPDRGRLSLYAMSRPETSHGVNGPSALPKQLKSKPSRTFDFDSHDDTNYEALALSSPRKSSKADDLDGLLSDEDDVPVVTAKAAVASKASSSAAPAPKSALNVVPTTAKKGRGRPAGSKNKGKDEKEKPAKAKPAHLSPAAKAYAAKKAKARSVISDDEDDDDDVVMRDDPLPVAPRARAARGAATGRAKKPVYVVDDDDEEEEEPAAEEQDESDDFAMYDSD